MSVRSECGGIGQGGVSVEDWGEWEWVWRDWGGWGECGGLGRVGVGVEGLGREGLGRECVGNWGVSVEKLERVGS